MAYSNTPKVGATYLDGNLRRNTFSTQGNILFVGPASNGLTDEIFDVSDTGAAEVEFGSESIICKGMHEAIAQRADNISLMRIGGRSASWVFTDSAGQTLTIIPSARDAQILDRYALVIEQYLGENRVLVYDTLDEEWVYDSAEILLINEDIVDVTDTGIDNFVVGRIAYVNEAKVLSALVIGDFIVAAGGSATATTVVATAGSDGVDVSLVEKYAALNNAYHILDFEDMDYIVPKGVYIDDQNIAKGDACDFFKGVPAPGSSIDSLGYVWQYEYQGSVYTYFVDQSDHFTETKTAATVTVNTNLTLTAAKTGTGGNSISIQIAATGPGAPVITITEPTPTSLLILVTAIGTATTAQAVSAINTALGLYTMANGKLASTLVTASGGSATVLVTTPSTPLAGGQGGHVLTPVDLTGVAIPAAVSTKFSLGQNSQLRECNFAHQLASFCYKASTTWKDIQAAISVKAPSGYSKTDIATWVGSPPKETVKGLDIAIESPSDNGSGLLGMKLLAGQAITSNGYRAHMIENGDATDGYLYGGLIATQGLSLPNEGEDWAYGIEDGDELLDSNSKPVDIGKHLWVTVDWPIHRNSFNGGSSYRGSSESLLIGLLVTVPDNEEPIGQDWVVSKISSVPKIHASQRDMLSKFRLCSLRREENVGYVFSSVRTAAHKLDSDYTRGSTIRCVNRMLRGIRNIAKAYIGKAFSPIKIIALQADIDGYIAAERRREMHLGALARISYTNEDRILGKLEITVQMVPPFTIEQITETLSLAADESELA